RRSPAPSAGALLDAARGSTEGQADSEERAPSGAGALGGNRAAVQLRKLLGDRKAEPEPALPACAGHPLAEAIEYVGQEVRVDAHAGITDLELHAIVHPMQPYIDAAAGGGEFDGIGEQVPGNLLNSIGIGAHRCRATGQIGGETDPP